MKAQKQTQNIENKALNEHDADTDMHVTYLISFITPNPAKPNLFRSVNNTFSANFTPCLRKKSALLSSMIVPPKT